MGDMGGSAYVDGCGLCVGGSTGYAPCGMPNNEDCYGEVGGVAYYDDCGYCVGGNSGLDACLEKDCHGDRGGTAYYDKCGYCVDGKTGKWPCIIDCAGVKNGSARLDKCNQCVGGTTNITPCTIYLTSDAVPLAYSNGEIINICKSNISSVFTIYDQNRNLISNSNLVWYINGNVLMYSNGSSSNSFDISNNSTFTIALKDQGIEIFKVTVIVETCDCSGVPNGTAQLDNCNICSGGTTDIVPCTQDCNGDYGGTAYLDNCGVCVDGNTGKIACKQDCNGDWGGTAFLDNCCNCVEGRTGIQVICMGTTPANCINLCPYKEQLPIGTKIRIAESGIAQTHSVTLSTPGMISCENPPLPLNTINITQRQATGVPESFLWDDLNILFKLTTSTGSSDIKNVKDDMLTRFKSSHGGPTPISSVNNPFIDVRLTNAFTSDKRFLAWANPIKYRFAKTINSATPLISYNTDLIKSPEFNDWTSGLGILARNFTYSKAELVSFKYKSCTKEYIATIKYTLDDDFGLDAPDVLRQNSVARGLFKPWFVLQHYRCYHPFMIRIEYTDTVIGVLK